MHEMKMFCMFLLLEMKKWSVRNRYTMVCAVSADRIWQDKALWPSFIFPYRNSLWRSPLPLVSHLTLYAQAWGHFCFWSPTVWDGQYLASGTGSLFCKV